MNRTFSFLLALVMFFGETSAQDTPLDELTILSWNVYMLPGIANLSKQISKNHKKLRAGEIAEYLNTSDIQIVVFQEAFFKPSRRILSKQLKAQFPHQYGPANPSKLSLKTSSGIFVVSKIPLKVLGTSQYEACNGADCFAKKGAILLEGTFQDKHFQVLGTHLNAGGPQWIRQEQYKQIRNLLDDFTKLNVPQIICGDMNTSKESKENYIEMLEMMDVVDPPTTSAQKFTTAKNSSVIDYVFLKTNRSSIRMNSKEVLWINPNKLAVIEKLKGNLSDHLAVKAKFSW
tara:strand:- start:1833 stop:2696 length:864 start_codon:yes stop_codon:yes gene_type:complete